jgi:hypothetical protein
MILMKAANGTATNWYVYHRDMGRSAVGNLNLSNAFSTGLTNYWGTSDPSASSFTIDTNLFFFAGQQVMVYLFAHNAGGFGDLGTDNVISCGIYSTDPFSRATVNLGYEPQWILVKNAYQASDWVVIDAVRGFSHTRQERLRANTAGSATVDNTLRPTATGFEDYGVFGGEQTMIYVAIRRGPMKLPTSGADVLYLQAVAQSFDPDSTGVPWEPDTVMTFSRNGTDRNSIYNRFLVVDRLRGLGVPQNTWTSSTDGWGLNITAPSQETVGISPYVQLRADGRNITRGPGWNNVAYGDWIYYFLRRARGVFDLVHWLGNSADRNIAHSLGVVPELIIHKNRNLETNWVAYSAITGASSQLNLNLSNAAEAAGGVWWQNAAPTATTFPIGSGGNTINGNGFNYISMLFASLAGVSKVGSYTGTGATLQVNCGFSGAGARLVLVKRTNVAGNWILWDSARGIVAGADPYIVLNSTGIEAAADWIDPLSTGFSLSDTGGNDANINGATYLYLALA